MLLLVPVLRFAVVLLPAAWSDAKGVTTSIWGFLVSLSLLFLKICQVTLGYLWQPLLSACTHPLHFLASLLSNVSREAGIVGIVVAVNSFCLFLRYLALENGSPRVRPKGARQRHSAHTTPNGAGALFRAGEPTLHVLEGHHRRRKSATVRTECVLECGSTAPPGSRCPSEHALCAACTSKYLEQTLLPKCIVWWDRGKCLGSECTQYMEGMSVQQCTPPRLRELIDAAQLELEPKLGLEARHERERERTARAGRLDRSVRASRTAADRASEAYVAKNTKLCPSCLAQIKGCKHINCRCKHEYCWDCFCEWVVGHMSVKCAPRRLMR